MEEGRFRKMEEINKSTHESLAVLGVEGWELLAKKNGVSCFRAVLLQ